MKIGLKASLRVIISCFIVVPAAFSLIVGLKSLSRFSEMSVGQQMAELGSLKTAGIEQEINSYISELSAAASLEFITKAGSGLYADAKDETDSYIENTIKNYPFILDVAITDISGCVMADHIERKLGAFFPGHVAELNTLGKNEVYISKIFLKNSDFGDKDIFYMTKPLVRDDATVGFISFSVSSEAFSQAIESGRFLNNGELWIVDGNGAILGRLPNEATEYRDVTDTGLKNFIQNSLKPEFKNADIPYDTFDTGNRIGVYGIFSGFDWYWLSTYPSANLNQFYISYFIPLVLIEVGLVLVCFVVMFYISNMFISPL
ncbi:MAG: cache domain-containing protein, partial [Eubacterium sp.]|nr:cache domain-containing protein [Eubacterium sp.]